MAVEYRKTYVWVLIHNFKEAAQTVQLWISYFKIEIYIL